MERDLNLTKEICENHACIGFESGVGREERNRLWEARYEASESIERRHPDLDVL